MRMKRTVSQQSDVNGDCSAGFTSYNEKSEPSIECDVSKGVTRESELADSHCRANAHRAKIAGHNRLVKVNHQTRRQVATTVNTAGIPRPATRHPSPVTRAAQWDAAGRLERFLPHIQRNTPLTERSLVPVLSKCFKRSCQTIYPFIIKSKAVSRPTYDVELPTRRRKMKEGGREEEPTNAAEEVHGSRTERTCCCLGVLVGVSLIAALVAVILMKDTTVEVTVLRQVHVLMSHGERTPSERELAMLGAPPPEHVFAPYGAGALTNEGKMATFEMGALLRKRYNQFLGPYYEDGKHVVITSDTDLSKVSALLISAGLWPPPAEQVWNDTMQWQPVPYSYPPRDTDYLLYEENCPRYNQEKERILQAFTEEGLLAPYRDFFHKIATLTNTNFSTPREAFYLNNLFTIQDDIKVANPKWAKHVKRKLMDIARLEFMMMFHNNLLKKLSGGALLHQIIKESLESGSGRSLVVRIGSPVSVAALLAACVAPPPRTPDPGAALIIELHEKLPSNEHKAVDPIAKRYGFKIYYWDDDSAEPRLIEVVGCEAFCSLETFKHLTQQVLSYDYKEDCKLVPNDINIDGT